MTTIAIHHTADNLAAAVAAVKTRITGAITAGDERVTVNVAEQLLLMIATGGTWTIDDRGAWIEIERLPDDYLGGLEALREALP